MSSVSFRASALLLLLGVLLSISCLQTCGAQNHHSPPHIPSEFQADAEFKYVFLSVKGPTIYSYDKQSYVVDSKVPFIGATQRDIFRYDKNIHYQLVENPFGGGWQCQTEYLRGEIYPMAIPPIAHYQGIEVIRGVKTEKYSLDWGMAPANITIEWWADPLHNSLVQVDIANPLLGDFGKIQWNFDNFRPGIPSGPVFEPPPNANCPPPVCTSPIDVVMLLDGSGSISQDDWERAQQFSDKVLSKLKFNTDNPDQGPRFGVVQFSSSTRVEATLSTNAQELEKAIDSMAQMKSGTNTGAGLNAAQTLFNNKGREQAPHILFVVTDGEHNQGQDPGVVAKQMRDKYNTEIFAIGVGSDINKNELDSMASEPKDNHVFTVADWNALDSILDTLFKNSC